MATDLVVAEIERFLRSPTPEVLCLSGRWGVGKTYIWQALLDQAVKDGTLALPQYAYVSLFGVNSLAELRNSVVENSTVVTSEPKAGLKGLRARFGKGERLLRSRPAFDVAVAALGRKDLGEALYRAAFLTVRGQLICFDDLERAGQGMAIRDILGLASMLREQRGCKVALLLNREQLDGPESDELAKQLEKVVDVALTFEPSSEEAAAIAFAGSDIVTALLNENVTKLQITNIRVMKKIERWARQIEPLLGGLDMDIMKQMVSTVTLAGWALLQPGDATPIDFIRNYDMVSAMRGTEQPKSDWQEQLSAYGYTETDSLDVQIIDGVIRGYFDADRVRTEAKALQESLRQQNRRNTFREAWQRYHHHLLGDDDQVLDQMNEAALENLETIDTASLNGTVRFLRRWGRASQADDLANRYVQANARDPAFYSHTLHLGGDPIDPAFRDALASNRFVANDDRDPAKRLKAIASTNGYNPEEDAALLNRLTVADLVALFDDNPGEDLKGMVKWASIIASQPHADELSGKLSAAFAQIAARSPMTAARLQDWQALLPPGTFGTLAEAIDAAEKPAGEKND
jgi:hypothetical protein